VPAYWPGGVRRKGGVSPVCGICTEHGKANTESLPGGLGGWERESVDGGNRRR
jgi:hypothetical protein